MPKFRSALALTVLLAGCLAARALAQCEIPLIIGSGGSTANVLIIMDSSGSMNEIVYHTAYNPATSWSGNFTRTATYNIPTDGNYTPRSFNSKWPSTPRQSFPAASAAPISAAVGRRCSRCWPSRRRLV